MKITWRLAGVGGVIALMFSLLLLRMWVLQVTDLALALETAENQQVLSVVVEAPRGDIFDRDGKEIMAGTTASLRVVVDLRLVPLDQEEGLIQNLSALLGIPAADIRKEFDDRGSGARFPLGDEITQSTGVFVLENNERFPGVNVELIPVRVYPLGETAAHVVGYIGSPGEEDLSRPYISLADRVGKFGVERYYDLWLRGTPGAITYRVNAQGAILGILEEIRPQPGGSLVTTIDLDLQRFVESTLLSAIALARQDGEEDVLRASAVVLDPTDGSVLAMASVPSFDPAVFSDGRLTDAEWLALSEKAVFNNFAIQGLYPPGSSFKTIVYSLALEEGIAPKLEEDYADLNRSIDPTLFFCDGQLLFPSTPPLNDWKREGHGSLGLSESLRQSCNLYYWSLALEIWENRGTRWPEDLLQQWATKLGLGEISGIDLPFEQAGLVPDREWFQYHQQRQDGVVRTEGGWAGGDVMNIATGQGALTVTPLQMAVAYAALVNGGTVWEPRVASSVRDAENNVIFVNPPSTQRKIDLKPETVAQIRLDLNGVVNSPSGTARQAFRDFCDDEPDADCAALQEVGGKTGTAEIVQEVEATDPEDIPEPNQDPDDFILRQQVGKGDEYYTSPILEAQPAISTAWFVGAAPLSDPKWVVVVVIDQGGSGGRIAAPTARRIFQLLMGEDPDPLRPGTDTER
jgi:penicillin-binding protein 2